QAKPMPRIGYLSMSLGGLGEDAFRQGLRDFGYVEGKNLLVEYRRAGETAGQLDGFVAELIARKVDVIVTGGSQATRAALRQTKTIPIVALSSDPVGLGFVASLAKPGGNVTGVSLQAPEVAGKRLQLLKQLVPSITKVAVLWNPESGRIEARTGLRMMPTFPRPSLSFRTAGFSQYGWKAGFPSRSLPDHSRLSLLPACAVRCSVCIRPSCTS